MRNLLVKAEYAFAVVALILYSGGPLTVIMAGGKSEGDGEKLDPDFFLIRLIFLLIYAISGGLLIPVWRKAVYLLIKEKFIFLLIALTLTSVLWSFLPSLTIQRSMGLIGTTLFGVYLATRYSWKDQMKILGWALSLILLMSFMFAIGLPKYGVMGGIHTGAWRGIYLHKNVLGKIMVLSATYFCFLITQSKSASYLKLWIYCCISILLLVLSRSAASLVNFAILTVSSLVFQALRWRDRIAIPAILFLLASSLSISFLIILNSDTLFEFLGKDSNLTGRSDLWPAVITMISKQPWLGYGFSGFWKDLNSEGGYVWKATGWQPPNSHNGMLDLLLDLGILGFFLFLASCFYNLIKSARLILSVKSVEAVWALVYFNYLVLVNAFESSLLIQNNIFWVLYVSISLSLYSSLNPKPNTN